MEKENIQIHVLMEFPIFLLLYPSLSLEDRPLSSSTNSFTFSYDELLISSSRETKLRADSTDLYSDKHEVAHTLTDLINQAVDKVFSSESDALPISTVLEADIHRGEAKEAKEMGRSNFNATSNAVIESAEFILDGISKSSEISESLMNARSLACDSSRPEVPRLTMPSFEELLAEQGGLSPCSQGVTRPAGEIWTARRGGGVAPARGGRGVGRGRGGGSNLWKSGRGNRRISTCIATKPTICWIPHPHCVQCQRHGPDAVHYRSYTPAPLRPCPNRGCECLLAEVESEDDDDSDEGDDDSEDLMGGGERVASPSDQAAQVDLSPGNSVTSGTSCVFSGKTTPEQQAARIRRRNRQRSEVLKPFRDELKSSSEFVDITPAVALLNEYESPNEDTHSSDPSHSPPAHSRRKTRRKVTKQLNR